jgi:hypothetical protein
MTQHPEHLGDRTSRTLGGVDLRENVVPCSGAP